MRCDPQPLQALFLWRLLAGGGGFYKDIKPQLTKGRRNELVRAGLIAEEKQKDPRTGHHCNYVALTDAGWQWAEMHLDCDVSSRSPAAGPVLQCIMTLLKAHLARHQMPLAAFVDPSCDPATDDAVTGTDLRIDLVSANGQDAVAAAPLPPTNGSAELQRRVFSTCRELANGRPAARIRLATLRAALANVSRERLDQTLLAMEASESLVLYPLDDPQALSPADMEAALPNSAGFNRHILYLEN